MFHIDFNYYDTNNIMSNKESYLKHGYFLDDDDNNVLMNKI
jgi:hypothetical protein